MRPPAQRRSHGSVAWWAARYQMLQLRYSPGRLVRSSAVNRPGREQAPRLHLRDVLFVRDGRAILAGIEWAVRDGERWLVLGSNGSGKTTLLRIASLYEHPSTGTVDVLGERLGRTDVRVLRRRIGLASSGLAAQLRDSLTALRRRDDGEVRRPRALVAHVHRRGQAPGRSVPRSPRRRRLRGSHARHPVVRRAAAGLPRADADERSGAAVAGRAERPASTSRARAVDRRAG